MEEVMEDRRFASRKFLLTVAVLGLAAVYRELDMLSEAGWVDLTKWALGLYFGANVGTWAVDLLRGKV
jgi:hypothetical protein